MAVAVTFSGQPRGAWASSADALEGHPVVEELGGGLHGAPYFPVRFRPEEFGYQEHEFSFAGTARAYGASTPPALYVSRMLVYTPSDPTQFSGTVFVEWNNVTAQIDAPIELQWLYPQVIRHGDGYVAVTVQEVGLCGVTNPVAGPLGSPTCVPTSVKGWDPVRYAALHHPGDGYAADIFSQALAAVQGQGTRDVLGGLSPEVVIAVGQSQSAYKLNDYIALGADNDAQLADAFLIDAPVGRPEPDSYRVPTIQLHSEESARQGPMTGNNLRVWSVAGAPHGDHWVLQHITAAITGLIGSPRLSRDAELAAQEIEGAYGETGPDVSTTCAGSSRFPRRYLVDAAAVALDTWVRTGSPAPSAPPLDFLSEPTQYNLVTLFNTDHAGNTVGGIRSPILEVPVATYDGTTCALLGTSIPLLPARLRELYPTHAAYVGQMLAATQTAVSDRFMTPFDGADLFRRACASAIPEWGFTRPAQQPSTCADPHRAVLSASQADAAQPRPSQPNTATNDSSAASPVAPPRGPLPATGSDTPWALLSCLVALSVAARTLTRRARESS